MLGALFVCGLALAWRGLPRDELRAQASLPIGLLAGLVFFILVTAYGRGDFPEVAGQSHYMEVTAVMVLPALAVAAQAVANKGRVVALAVPLVFLIGIPGSLWALDDAVTDEEALMEATEPVSYTHLTLPTILRV